MDDPQTPVMEDESMGSVYPESPAEEPPKPEPLTYEETPVIEPPVASESQPPLITSPEFPPMMSPPKPKGSFGKFMGNLVLFAILFGCGVVFSILLRGYLAPQEGPASSPSPTVAPVVYTSPTPVASQSPLAAWKTYQVISGITRLPIEGMSFQLPPDVLSPICDGGACGSQGTYLPGGSRFTVAPRGQNQVLADYRGKVVSDLAGKAFVVRQATFLGRPAIDFTGNFMGTTVGGYAFSKMHGVMIEVSPTLSLEINHFVPSGITADFVSDDTLFTQILATVVLPGGSGEKGAVIPLPTTSPIVNPTGY